MNIAAEIKTDKNIPLTMGTLNELKGIGRKSANVIMREAGVKAEGIMVDLHVVRVVPSLRIAKSANPKMIEEELMAILRHKIWSELGMAISQLGRETCRPTNPKNDECVLNTNCEYCSLKMRKEKSVKLIKVVKKNF